MKGKYLVSIFLAAVLAAGTLTGCGGPSAAGASAAEGPAQRTDTVVIAMDPNSEPAAGFDPAFGWGAGEHVHEPLIQSTLTVTNTDLTIGYDLATDYVVSGDGLTWTVHIREDAGFTDGEPLTAADVAFTYNTVKSSSSVNDFTMLDFAEAADDTTVVFHMTRPFSIWPYTMAIVGIVPEHAYDPTTYGANPIGSGRYELVQWDRGQQVILEANPDYQLGRPGFDRLVITVIDKSNLLTSLIAGDLDYYAFGGNVSVEDAEVARAAGLEVLEGTVPNSFYELMLNNETIPSAAVRRAIDLALDKEALCLHTAQGLGEPAASDLTPGTGYDSGLTWARNVDGAKALLAEGGYDGRTYTLACTANRSGLAALMQQELAEAEEQEAAQYELFCQRVRAMEKRGTVSYWSVLFNAESFTDLLSRVDFINEIMASDQRVIDDLKALQEQIEETKASLEDNKAEEEAAKAEAAEEVTELTEEPVEELEEDAASAAKAEESAPAEETAAPAEKAEEPAAPVEKAEPAAAPAEEKAEPAAEAAPAQEAAEAAPAAEPVEEDPRQNDVLPKD